MNQYISLVRLSAVAIVVVVVGALLGWYYFLHGQNAQTTAQSNAAGYNASAPTFKGSTGSTYANVVSTLGQDSGTSTPPSAARLWEVSQVPVAGFGWYKGTSTPTIYFVERSSGYVLAGNTDGRNVTRLTDTLRPKIYEASVTLDGSVLEQSVDDSGTLIAFAGIIASSTKNSTSSTQDLVGNTLPQGIHSIAADPVSDTLFFAIPGPGGVSVVSTNFAGAKEKQLFSSAIAGWRFFAPGDGSLALLQAPLDGDVGHAYQLKSGGLSLIAQAPGLTILPRASSGL